ncbi:Hypp4128 [Branchiostoma lanceolatum]|uniref:Hypp4128 protein n=1 Tax=Branchiostoma lanceolatum TaxID=7740 RepID=A0A8K0A899_BRALA|nr:Hypp4128 [Branchiostoma lanceolatum]
MQQISVSLNVGKFWAADGNVYRQLYHLEHPVPPSKGLILSTSAHQMLLHLWKKFQLGQGHVDRFHRQQEVRKEGRLDRQDCWAFNSLCRAKVRVRGQELGRAPCVM